MRNARCHPAVLQNSNSAVEAAEQIEHVRLIQTAEVSVFVIQLVLLPHPCLELLFKVVPRHYRVAVLVVVRLQDLDNEAVDGPERLLVHSALQSLRLVCLNPAFIESGLCVGDVVPGLWPSFARRHGNEGAGVE